MSPRAEVNTDAIAANMNVFDPDHRVGGAHSRPTPTPAPTRANANPLENNDLSVHVAHACGRLAAESRGQLHATMSSELVDGAAHTERTTIEYVSLHHRRADVRVEPAAMVRYSQCDCWELIPLQRTS